MGTDITALVAELGRGDNEALGRIVSALYADLRRLAHARLKKQADNLTLLDTTSLVHESYLRFLKAGQIQVKDRAHFLAYAARVMRSIVVDFARKRAAERRGGKDARVTVDGDLPEHISGDCVEILRVHLALEELSRISERLVKVVEMRYFVGMNEAEIAEALGVTERTVRRDWEKARMLLLAAVK